jgi:acylphosphatase
VTTSSTAAEILVEGRVQGVGYRAYAARCASRLGLTGYVANLADGRVRIHAEGDDAIVRELITDLEQGPRLARVDRVRVRWLPPSRRFASFEVRHAEEEA